MIRFRTGTSLLNKVVKQFDQAVADLQLAEQQIQQQRTATLTAARAASETNMEREDRLDDLVYKIQMKLSRIAVWYSQRNVAAEGALYDKEQQLYRAQVRANTVRANIAKLVGAA